MSIGTEADPQLADEQVMEDQNVESPEESGMEAAGKIAEGTDAPSGDTPEPLEQEAEPSEDSPREAAEEPSEWMTDDLVELGSSYGLTGEDIEEFGDAATFQRACRMVDRHLTAAATPEEEAAEEPSAEEPTEEPPPDQPSAENDFTLDPSKYVEYDEETQRLVKVANHLQQENRQLRSEVTDGLSQFDREIRTLKQERQEERHHVEITTFHECVDKMDPKLFGGTSKLTEETDGRRKKLWEAYNTVRDAAVRSPGTGGRPARMPLTKALVDRAALLAFGDEIIEQNRRDIHRSIHEQSRKVRPRPGKGKARSTPPTKAEPQTVHEASQEIANDPEIVSLFDRVSEKSGNAPQ